MTFLQLASRSSFLFEHDGRHLPNHSLAEASEGRGVSMAKEQIADEELPVVARFEVRWRSHPSATGAPLRKLPSPCFEIASCSGRSTGLWYSRALLI